GGRGRRGGGGWGGRGGAGEPSPPPPYLGEPPVGGVPGVSCCGIGCEVPKPRRHLPDLRDLEQGDRAAVAQPLALGRSVGGSPHVRGQGRLAGSEGAVPRAVRAAVPAAGAPARADSRPGAWIWRPLVGGEGHVERPLRIDLEECVPALAARRGRGSEREPLATKPVELVLQARATTDADQAELKPPAVLDPHPVGPHTPSGRLEQPPGAVRAGGFSP